MRRLQVNQGGYGGERIDVQSLLARVSNAAGRHGWREEQIRAGPGVPLTLLRRTADSARARVYVSTGIHGDEPAGPLAVCELLEDDDWPTGLDFWVVPCLNPSGFERNCRENPGGWDLNRDYRERRTAEVQGHVAWLEAQSRFEVAMCLHEDWEADGFYLYELNPAKRRSAAEEVVLAVSEICPIDRAPLIEGRRAKDGIIRPRADLMKRKDWPEAFYLVAHKTGHSYTFEAPSDYALITRVQALKRAVATVLEAEWKTSA